MIRKMIMNFLAKRLEKSLHREVEKLNKDNPSKNLSDRAARAYDTMDKVSQGFAKSETHSLLMVGRKNGKVNTIIVDLYDENGLREFAAISLAHYLMLNGKKNSASVDTVVETSEHLITRWIDMDLIGDIKHIIRNDYDAKVPYTFEG